MPCASHSSGFALASTKYNQHTFLSHLTFKSTFFLLFVAFPEGGGNSNSNPPRLSFFALLPSLPIILASLSLDVCSLAHSNPPVSAARQRACHSF